VWKSLETALKTVVLTWKMNIDERNALKNLEKKEVILPRRSVENHIQISVRILLDKPTVIVIHCKSRIRVLKNEDLKDVFFSQFCPL